MRAILRIAATTRAEGEADLAVIGARLWSWLSSPEHRPLLVLWVESYASSLRGAFLDLPATGDVERTTAAVTNYLDR